MKIEVTQDMVGRANALAPELTYATVKAMLEAAMSNLPLPVTLGIRDQVIAENMPEFVGGFLRHLRLHQIALVFHDGQIEGGKTMVTAHESLQRGVQSYSDQIGPEGADRLFKETCRSLWDASSGSLQTAKLA